MVDCDNYGAQSYAPLKLNILYLISKWLKFLDCFSQTRAVCTPKLYLCITCGRMYQQFVSKMWQFSYYSWAEWAYNYSPLSKNAISAFQFSCKLLIFTLKIPKEINTCSSMTKSSIYHFKHSAHADFYLVVDWSPTLTFNGVTTMVRQILYFY